MTLGDKLRKKVDDYGAVIGGFLGIIAGVIFLASTYYSGILLF